MKQNLTHKDTEKTVDDKNRSSNPALSPPSPGSQPLHQLPATLGNQAFQGLLANGGGRSKLEVSHPDDADEKEADRVADEIMRKRDVPIHSLPHDDENPANTSGNTLLARKPQDSAVSHEVPAQSLASANHPRAAGLPGNTRRGLSADLRAFFEPRFGRDLGQVRVHSDKQAEHAAESVRARAFTLGRDIAFGAGQYQPQTRAGKHLIAHELAHVLQQERSVTSVGLQRKPTDNPPLNSPTFRSHPIFRQINEDDSKFLQKRSWMWQGPHITILQNALLELNYDLPVYGADGKFGDEVEEAIKDFQWDSGLDADQVNGVLDHKTLRLLDNRLSTKTKQRIVSSAKGNYLAFDVPVESVDIPYRDFLQRTLIVMFQVSPEETRVLIEDLGWRLAVWDEEEAKLVPVAEFKITPADEFAGFKTMYVERSQYESIKGEIRRGTAGKISQSIRPELEEQVFGLAGTERLYDLNKALAEKESEVIRAGVGRVPKEWLERLLAERTALEKERDKELLRLGLTVETFAQKGEDFKETFGKFAAETAFDMLEENATQARIEHARYGKLEGVEQVKAKLLALNTLYEQADSLWWQGISLEKSGDPHTIKNDKDLGKYVFYYGDFEEEEAVAFTKDLYEKYRSKERGKNTYFEQCYDVERSAFDILKTAAQKYPILAYPGLAIRQKTKDYVAMDTTALQAVLLKVIGDPDSGILENIKKTREAISANYKQVWSLPPVIARAKNEMGILKDSIHDILINEAVKDYEDLKFWRDIGLAALGIGLGLLALASGPVGWAALAGSITVGAFDAYIQYEEISTKRTAADTALDPSKALLDVKPGWFWFYVSLISLGLDVGAAAKLVVVISKSAKAAKTGGELVEATMDAVKAERKLLEEAIAAAEGEELAKLLKQLEDLTAVEEMAKSAEFAKKASVLVKVIDDPVLFARLGPILDDPHIADALTKLGARLDPDAYTDVLRFYGGPGRNYADMLPEALELADKANLQTVAPDLFREILTSPKVQKVILDNADDPETILRAWRTWNAAKTRLKPPPVRLPFDEYLSQGLKYRTSLTKTKTLLTDEFGRGFAALDNATKNREVLRTTEGPLLSAIRQGDVLPPKAQAALDALLKDDLIGSATTLERAREKIIKQVNIVLGKNIDNISDYNKAISLISQPGSRGAVGELFAEAADLIPGLQKAVKASIELAETGLEEFKGVTRIIIDRFIKDGGIVAEIKVGGSFDKAQLLRYKKLYEAQDILEEVLIDAGIRDGQINKIIYQVLPGPDDLTRVAKVVDPAKQADRIFKTMKELGMEAYSEVYYLDRAGNLWRLDSAGKAMVKTID